MTPDDLEKFKVLWADKTEIQSFCQSPFPWLIKRNLWYLFPDLNANQPPRILYPILRDRIFLWVIGPAICVVCGQQHHRILNGWKRGWCKTCSKICQKKERSDGQKGAKNTSHRMSNETRSSAAFKISETHKANILAGLYTPQSQNYLSHGMIEFRHFDNTIRKVRSLWELIYWLEHPNLEYETVRISYFCTRQKTNRVYIADFYDHITHTVYEVKPIKYQPAADDKRTGALAAGYNFEWVDEHHITKTPEVLQQIHSCVLDVSKIEKRLQWIKYRKFVKS